MADYYGLTLKEVQKRREIYGYNEIRTNSKKKLLKQLKHIFSEPIYLLLSCAAIIYFLLGEATDGIFMIAFVIFVIGIDVFQEIRTGNSCYTRRKRNTIIRQGTCTRGFDAYNGRSKNSC